MLYVWYPKNRKDLNTILEENDVIEMQEKLARVKRELKWGKHTCLIMRMEHPRAYRVLSQDCYKTPISTPIKRLQDSYQEIIRLLIRDYSTFINRL